jgi:NNP family nitrate/nitrite transporter-like MFS transporter
MDSKNRATSLWSNLFNFRMPQIRTFHMSWFAFFLCFFAWFGIAPLMAVVRDELALTESQVGWCIIASVAFTVVARLFAGWLCDRIGPRLTYTWLLVLGSIPVMGIGLAHDFATFLVFRLMIGAIGASFVITQYHTSVMFAPNIVGTANATSAGWGNAGGGVTQLAMPAVLALLVVVVGCREAIGWRVAMFAAGLVCMATGVAYYFLTQDVPEGNFKALRAEGLMPGGTKVRGSFQAACKDFRVWALFVIYAACFGMELTINNVAALYFRDYFDLSLTAAGMTAALFGVMNLFARTLGGFLGDKFGGKWGLKGRVFFLFLAVFCEGLALMLFSQMTVLALAIPGLVLFSLCVQMSSGATFSVVPFINKKALGAVAGIVGAGGNVGAVAAGFLFMGAIAWPTALLVLGALVVLCSFVSLLIRFTPEAEIQSAREYRAVEHESLPTAVDESETREWEPVLT